MPVYIKAGGAWQQCLNEHLRFAIGGYWASPGFLAIKSGGIWRYSDYAGTPPKLLANFGINSWDFSKVVLGWDRPDSIVPIDHFQVVEADEPGNWLNVWNITFDPDQPAYTLEASISEDLQRRYYVRSVSPVGILSEWQSLGIHIGHSEQGHYEGNTYVKTRDYLANSYLDVK